MMVLYQKKFVVFFLQVSDLFHDFLKLHCIDSGTSKSAVKPFVSRLLRKRPLQFMHKYDEFLLRDGRTGGTIDFQLTPCLYA